MLRWSTRALRTRRPACACGTSWTLQALRCPLRLSTWLLPALRYRTVALRNPFARVVSWPIALNSDIAPACFHEMLW